MTLFLSFFEEDDVTEALPPNQTETAQVDDDNETETLQVDDDIEAFPNET